MKYELSTKRLGLIKAIRKLTLRHSIDKLQRTHCIQLQFMLTLLNEGLDV